MASTSKIIIETIVSGLPEGGSARNRFVNENSTGAWVTLDTTVGQGLANATTVSNPPNAKYMIILPPSTNTAALRITQSTAEVGIPLSSRDASVLTIPPSTASSTYFLYTGSTRDISGVRVKFL